MNQNDLEDFTGAVDFAFKVIRKPAIDDPDVLDAWFAVLGRYSLKQVTDALQVAVTHPQSRYGLDPALIVECMGIKEEKELTWKGVIALARNPVTPIGVLARIHIKSFNLNEKKDLDLHYEAQQFLDDLPDMKARALAGNYTQHEVNVMIERGVRPTAPFMDGMPSYQQLEHNDPLRMTFDGAKESDYFKEVLARKESEAQNGLDNLDGQRKVAEILTGLFPEDKNETAAIESDKQVYNKLMGKVDK